MRGFYRLAAFITAIAVAGLGFAGCMKQQEEPEMLQYNADGSVVMPEEGEEVAVISVKDYGDITIRLFPDEAPKAVENFVTLAKEGYYDNLTFHRVIDGFMIQGGDPRGDGTGGQSAFGSDFEDEFSDNLYNFTGALSMANAGPDTNGSQFFINEDASSVLSDDFFDTLLESNRLASEKYGYTYGRQSYAESVKDIYEQVGGNPFLDGVHTVFGQVVEGMDVVHAIAETATDDDNAPLEHVIIETIQIVPYHAES